MAPAGEKQREGKIDTQRDREGDTDTDTDTDADRQIERDRQIDRYWFLLPRTPPLAPAGEKQREGKIDTERDRDGDTDTDTDVDRQIERDRQIDIYWFLLPRTPPMAPAGEKHREGKIDTQRETETETQTQTQTRTLTGR